MTPGAIAPEGLIIGLALAVVIGAVGGFLYLAITGRRDER